MKSYEEKRQVLCNLAELYLDNDDKSHIDVNDGIIDSDDLDSIIFLILMALTYSNDDANFYTQGIEIDDETRRTFVDTEFDKVSSLKGGIVKKGKIVLDDAKAYYNRKFNNISIAELNKIAKKLDDDGFHI